MMAFGGFTRPPTRMDADFPGVGGNGLAPVAQHSTKYAANHATHLSAGHASWHGPGHTTEAPPKLSGSTGASLISATCLGMIVGAKSLPVINLARDEQYL